MSAYCTQSESICADGHNLSVKYLFVIGDLIQVGCQKVVL